jgi:hypothetical protein
MALKRWRWVLGPVLAALLVAVVVLPPQVPARAHPLLGVVWGYYDFVYQTGNGHGPYANDVQYARQTQQARLRHAILADSIVAVARGPRALISGDGLVTLAYETPLTADSARFWLNAVTRELALYPRGPTPGMRLVVALLSDPVRARPGNPEARYERGIQELLDQAVAAGACVVTVNLLPNNWRRLTIGHDLAGKPVSRLLGACALYARFGAPGAGVSRWAAPEFNNYWRDPLTVQLREARRSVRRYEVPRDIDYWNGSPWFGAVRWVAVGCLRGAAALCLRASGLGPQLDSPFPFYRDVWLPRTQLVAHLLATGTPEQFAVFWHSPRPAADALASAYGEPAGRLAMSAFQHWYTAPAPGTPWGSARDSLVGLVWIGLALALAVVAGRRWTTEI